MTAFDVWVFGSVVGLCAWVVCVMFAWIRIDRRLRGLESTLARMNEIREADEEREKVHRGFGLSTPKSRGEK